MTERVPSSAVETIRATLKRRGATARPSVRLPASSTRSIDADVVGLTVDDSYYHAPVVSVTETVALAGAYDNPRRARERDGDDHLSSWLESTAAVEFGRSVLVDVVEPGSQYGLRAPGTDAVYRVRRQPDGDLQDIARSLE